MLNNVAVIRPLLILLLVFYHAFAPYSGAWAPINNYPDVPIYWWLDKLSYAFMLEMFVFVSGYVFGFQVRTKGESKLEIRSLLWGKFKRLIIPCMVFSLLYILLLGNIFQPIGKTLYGLVNGVGHMWFLPMLFWCFVAIWIIEKLKIKPHLVIPILFLCSICSFLPLPLEMNGTMYYMFFFYIGYFLQKEDICVDRLYTLKTCILLITAFLFLFPSLTLLNVRLDEFLMGGGENQLFMKVVRVSLYNLFKLIYSFAGCLMCFVIVGTVLNKKGWLLPLWMLKIGGLCMGVYLIQQFLLKGMYNHTMLPAILGCYWLPWVGFVFALLGSVMISYFLGKTKIGKFLIG